MGTVLKPPFYILSDTHFNHRRITQLADRPYDWEVMLLKRWKRAVKQTDTLLHLGDLFFGGEDGYNSFKENLTPELPGKVKYLVLGNHDRKKWDYEALGFTVIKPFSIKYRGYEVSFDHYPKLLTVEEERKAKRFHIHGHIHSHPYARGETVRWGNINVSVEALNYRPHRITRLLNHAIRQRNQKRNYVNSRHVRWQRRDSQRRAA